MTKTTDSKDKQEFFTLPSDFRRKRIFWILGSVFALLLCAAMVLIILLLDIARPPGFGVNIPPSVANFQSSFYGPAGALLDRPTGVAVSLQDEVYVSDTGNARVVVFDKDGAFLREISRLQMADNEQDTGDEPDFQAQNEASTAPYLREIEGTPEAFMAPTSLAFSSDGRWFAVDQSLQLVLFFDQNDYLTQAIAFEEEVPISVSVNLVGAEERLFVTTRSGIVSGNLDGEFDQVYMNWGLLSGQLDNPAAVVVFDPAHMSEEASISTTDTAPLTIVADALNNRVQAFRDFETEPEVAWIFGKPILDGDVLEELDYEFENMIVGNISFPVDMALSPLARVFVVDGLSSEIIVLDAQTGAFQYSISSVGTRDGYLYYPAGVCFSEGNIYVTDRFNDRLSVFEDAPPVPVQNLGEGPTESPNRWFLMILPLLALLLTLLRLLTLRMPRYVLDLSFLERLSEDDDLLIFVIEHFNSLTIVPGTESVAEKMLPNYGWKIEVAKEAKRDDIIEKYPNLDDLEAESLALATKKKGRSYLLTAARPVEHAGKELGLKVLPFAEFHALAYAIIAEERARQEEIEAIAAEKAAKKAASEAGKVAKKTAKKAEVATDKADDTQPDED